MIPSNEPQIKRNDPTPSVLDQAKAAGWDVGVYSFGKAESPDVTYFNPGLVRRPDGLWLLVRRSENVPGSPFGINSIWAILLDESGRNPIKGVKLKWNGEQEGQQFEDARVFLVEHLNQVGVSACTFKWHGNNSWTGAIQVLGFFDADWNCKRVHYVPFENNATSLETIPRERYQKNWLFWMRDQRLTLLYKSDPWTVAEFAGHWQDRRVYVNEGAKWGWGEPRGGTPPVLVGDKYYTFFHSSVPWRGNYRRYAMGAIAFSPEPPFEILAMTKEPLLIGSQNDEWQQRRPLCIFPTGAVLENNRWLITCGVNDIRAAWVEIPHESLLERMKGGDALCPSARAIPSLEKQDAESILTASHAAPTFDPERAVAQRKRRKRRKRRTPEQQAVINERMARVRAKKKIAQPA